MGSQRTAQVLATTQARPRASSAAGGIDPQAGETQKGDGECSLAGCGSEKRTDGERQAWRQGGKGELEQKPELRSRHLCWKPEGERQGGPE